MHGLFRAVFVAAAVASGSWVGLGRPAAGQLVPAAREAATKAWTSVGAPHIPYVPPEPSGKAKSPPIGVDPLPHQTDATTMPAIGPWPRLNPDASIARAWQLAEGPHKTTVDNRRLVTLTFDDGPFPETTPDVLRLLARYKVRATFFVIGRYLDGDEPRAVASRKLLQRIVAEGHLVGNHSHDHLRLTGISRVAALDQIDQGALSIERALGKKPILFRPPYGALDAFGENAVRERGLDVLLWSAEVHDMERDDPQQMARELIAQIDYKDGGIVLLHDIRRTSVAALEKLLERMSRRRFDPKRPERWGYELVDLPHFLREVGDAPPALKAPREDVKDANGS